MNDNNKQLTAVEWLEGQLYFHGINPNIELFKQAKEMEKQQIMDHYTQGRHDGDNIRDTDAEEIYNQTFNLK